MARFKDVEMLNNALQTLGEGAERRRAHQNEQERAMQQLAIESQLRDVQQSRADAQQQHYSAMEDKYDNQNKIANDKNAILAKNNDDKIRIQEQGKIAAKQFSDSRDAIMQFSQTLRENRLLNQQDPLKGMTQADAVGAFKAAMDTLPPALHDQMLQNPNYGSLYKGTIDFASLPQVDKSGFPIPPKQPTPGTMDETTKTVHHPAVPGTAASPEVSHWFRPNDPAVAATPDQPAWDEVIKKHIANGGSITAGDTAPAAPAPAAAPPTAQPAQQVDPRDVQAVASSPTPGRISAFESVYGPGSWAKFGTQQPIPTGGGLPIPAPPDNN